MGGAGRIKNSLLLSYDTKPALQKSTKLSTAQTVLCFFSISPYIRVSVADTSLPLLILIPELHRCQAVHFLKDPIKMLYILIAYGFRDAFHCRIAAFQHCPGFFHPHLFQNIPEGLPGFFFDILGKIGLGKIKFFRKVIQRHGLIICVNIIGDLQEPLILTLLPAFDLLNLIYRNLPDLSSS